MVGPVDRKHLHLDTSSLPTWIGKTDTKVGVSSRGKEKGGGEDCIGYLIHKWIGILESILARVSTES